MDEAVVRERRHLMSLCFRMLGTIAEAEDAVQETYSRWYRMSALERDVIEIPQAWLTRVAGRICLDVLQSARSRRERYVGEWLPEPLPAATFGAARAGATDPLDRVSLDESVSTALLLVLESMTPAERVAFVLHDVFALPFDEIAEIVGRSPAATRQLATSARRRISGDRAREATRSEHDDVVRAFAIACQTGDMAALIAVLDPRVAVRSDGGGRVSAARRPVHGADAVARFLFGILTKRPGMRVSEQQTGDGLAFAMWEEGRIVGVVNLGVLHGVVSEVWIMLNPDKLTMWSELSDPFFGASPTS
ncbi:sigma-70 family RNA polymerase sigma factor [Naasia lichenicola]|uniref:Sigma-70 family RNA polymerase sigma factor n=2 Tax=Naasia lichenicola TaxID=2565933 RepID=A0A4S4FUE3_9MICO|nr:sigma-70 family RNA polymerase sigma factor [Naasia lichenicola]